MDATFLTETFPNVTDVSVTEVPIYVSGNPYFIKKEVSIEGIIQNTGAAVVFEEILPNATETGSLAIGTYTLSGLSFDSINYGDTDYDVVQPYTAKFSSYDQSGFLDIVDEWTYQEDDNKILSIKHRVSARSELPCTGDGGIQPRVIAFVQGRSSGVNVVPIAGGEFTTFGSLTKVGVEEISDVALGSYSLINSYQAYGEGAFYGNESRINSVSLNINYDRPSEKVSVSANGSSIGPLQTGLIQQGLPSGVGAEDVLADISSFVVDSVNSSLEGYSLEDIYPVNSSFTVSPEENKVDFSYNFEQVPSGNLIGENKNVLHLYETSFNIDKISQPYVTCSINGNLTYAGVDNPLTGQDLLTSARWTAIERAFSGLNPDALVATDLSNFTTTIGSDYKLGTATPSGVSEPTAFTVNKNLESLSIDYSYSYSTKYDIGSGVYNDLNLSTSKILPIDDTGVVETINGFSTGLNGKKAGTISVSASSQNSESFLSGLKTLAFSKMGTGGAFIIDSSEEAGDNNISFSVSKYYI